MRFYNISPILISDVIVSVNKEEENLKKLKQKEIFGLNGLLVKQFVRVVVPRKISFRTRKNFLFGFFRFAKHVSKKYSHFSFELMLERKTYLI